MNKDTDISFDNRFQECKVINVEQHVVHLALLSPLKNVEYARVKKEHFDENLKNSKPGDILPVFLLKPTSEDHKLWIASGKWAKKEENPWLTTLPSVGNVITGTVKSYNDDYLAFVELENGLEAKLHRKNIPGVGYEDIKIHLFVGDLIQALVEEVSRNDLWIDLSVTKWVELKTQEEERKRSARNLYPEEKILDDLDEEKDISVPLRLKEKRILIIDDDKNLSDAMKGWLESLGMQVSTDAGTAVSNKIDQCKPTHAFLDFDLGLNANLSDIAKTLKNTDTVTAVISAHYKDASEWAVKNEFGFIKKPITLEALIDWLENGKSEALDEVDATGEVTNSLWKASLDEKQVIERSNRFLKEICEQNKCLAAIWVKREREGVYSIRAQFGFEKNGLDGFTPEIGKTLIASVIETKKAVEHKIEEVGPLKVISPKDTRNIWGMPLDQDGITDRCLVFFKAGAFEEATKKAIEEQKPRMRDLVDHLALIQRLREVEAFAALGRVQAGLLHEVRSMAGILSGQARKVAQNIMQPDCDLKAIEKGLQSIKKEADKLSQLSRINLSMVKKQRREKVIIREVVSRIKKLATRFEPANPNLIIDTIGLNKDLFVSMPPVVLEQVLINLLDNAIFHLGKMAIARIKISADIKLEDSNGIKLEDRKMPLTIYVEDNGPGMTYEQKSKLFSSRESSKGVGGFGMGLYVSRNLLQSIGGDLECDWSIRWKGTCFKIKLPMIIKSNPAG